LKEPTGYQDELTVTLAKQKGPRQFLQGHIRRVKLRIAEVEQLLVGPQRCLRRSRGSGRFGGIPWSLMN